MNDLEEVLSREALLREENKLLKLKEKAYQLEVWFLKARLKLLDDSYSYLPHQVNHQASGRFTRIEP